MRGHLLALAAFEDGNDPVAVERVLQGVGCWMLCGHSGRQDEEAVGAQVRVPVRIVLTLLINHYDKNK